MHVQMWWPAQDDGNDGPIFTSGLDNSISTDDDDDDGAAGPTAGLLPGRLRQLMQQMLSGAGGQDTDVAGMQAALGQVRATQDPPSCSTPNSHVPPIPSTSVQ